MRSQCKLLLKMSLIVLILKIFLLEAVMQNQIFVSFEASKKKIEKFDNSLKQLSEKIIDSFFNAVLWGTYFKLQGKKASFNGDLQQCLRACFLQDFHDLKSELILDITLDTFEKVTIVNDMLFEKKLFLRLYVFQKEHEKK